MVEGAGFRPALGDGGRHRLYYLKSLARRSDNRAVERAAGRRARGRAAGARGRRRPRARAPGHRRPQSCIRRCSRRSRGWASRRSTPTRSRRLRAAWARTDDRHHRHRLGQVAVLQPADARRAVPRRRARVRSTCTRPRRSPRIRRVRSTAFGLHQARAPRDLRRRHAPRGARADRRSANVVADQPRHAARRHPAQPRRVGGPVRQPRGGGGRRGPRLPRRVRLARRQRAAAAATDRRRLRHRAALPARLRDDRQPASSSPSA